MEFRQSEHVKGIFYNNLITLFLNSYKKYCYILALLLYGFSAQAQGLLFVDLTAFQRNDLDQTSSLPENDLLPKATLFYSDNFDNIKVLAEFVANDKKSHFGRVKIGWLLATDSLIWLGRSHNPASYWRDQYHHGGWLQPTISRPAIAEFETPGGITPAHITGLMYEGGSAVNHREGVAYYISAGYGSSLNEDGLDVPDLVESNRGVHDSSFAFKLAYHFDSFSGGNETGLYSSFNHIPNEMQAPDEIEQFLYGAYINWDFEDIIITSEINKIESTAINQTTHSQSMGYFTNIYVMADYNLTGSWNIYTRIEDTSDDNSNIYVSSFPRFISKRTMLGSRYSLTKNQSIKFELEESERFSGDSYRQISFQWSLVYP